jgi:hypothetical protein
MNNYNDICIDLESARKNPEIVRLVNTIVDNKTNVNELTKEEIELIFNEIILYL